MKNNGCPECGCHDVVESSNDDLGKGYRVCKYCLQEWYICTDYDSHVNARQEGNIEAQHSGGVASKRGTANNAKSAIFAYTCEGCRHFNNEIKMYKGRNCYNCLRYYSQDDYYDAKTTSVA